jgi:predicted transposase YbfD/YdcC
MSMAQLDGRRLIQATSNGTRGLVRYPDPAALLAVSAKNVGATARWIERNRAETPCTLVCTGLAAEDRACARYLSDLLHGSEPRRVDLVAGIMKGAAQHVRAYARLPDALHAQAAHARDVTARGAHLLVTVKANQPTLLRRLRTLPWAQVGVGHRTHDRGHGRRETRTTKAVTVDTPGGLGFPHAAQAIRITRTRTIGAKTTRETAHLIATAPAEHAQPADLHTWARLEWHIENRLHWIRDVVFAEDAHQARTRNGPAVSAVLRNTAIGYHRSNGETNIARATRRADRRPNDLIHALVNGDPTTQ